MIWYHFAVPGSRYHGKKGTKKMVLVKFEASQGDVDLIRMHYGHKTASKAFASAAADAIPLFRRNQELQSVIESQKTEIARLLRVIENARSAAALLLEKTGQEEMKF
jgi:hypothetical protein